MKEVNNDEDDIMVDLSDLKYDETYYDLKKKYQIEEGFIKPNYMLDLDCEIRELGSENCKKLSKHVRKLKEEKEKLLTPVKINEKIKDKLTNTNKVSEYKANDYSNYFSSMTDFLLNEEIEKKPLENINIDLPKSISNDYMKDAKASDKSSRERKKERERDRNKESEKDKERKRDKHRDKDKHREKDIPKHGEKHKESGKHKDRELYKHTNHFKSQSSLDSASSKNNEKQNSHNYNKIIYPVNLISRNISHNVMSDSKKPIYTGKKDIDESMFNSTIFNLSISTKTDNINSDFENLKQKLNFIFLNRNNFSTNSTNKIISFYKSSLEDSQLQRHLYLSQKLRLNFLVNFPKNKNLISKTLLFNVINNDVSQIYGKFSININSISYKYEKNIYYIKLVKDKENLQNYQNVFVAENTLKRKVNKNEIKSKILNELAVTSCTDISI